MATEHKTKFSIKDFFVDKFAASWAFFQIFCVVQAIWGKKWPNFVKLPKDSIFYIFRTKLPAN